MELSVADMHLMFGVSTYENNEKSVSNHKTLIYTNWEY